MFQSIENHSQILFAGRRFAGLFASRAFWGVVIGLLLAYPATAMKRLEVDFEYVAAQAEKLSKKRYKEPGDIPRILSDLSYDKYRQIRYLNDGELWKEEGLPFVAGFFHLGYLYKNSVELHEFTSTHEQKIDYLDSFFDFGENDFQDKLPKRLGYAGFRLASDVENDGEYREVASFLGASYFRAVGQQQRFGSSARGLAINSGLSIPEEFPRFSEFWLGKPLGNATSMTIYALLESPSAAGAFAFTISPGAVTRMDVRCRLFLREDVESLGLSPLTSMYWRGENRLAVKSDYRPEVHDADGLIVWEAGKAPIWRPLDLSKKTRLSYIGAENLSGFGLMQRDRNFDHYQDMEADYHLRTSVWVEAKNDWGPGHVKLVELPTTNEFDDNIVAFWEPNELPKKGSRVDFEYAVHWSGDAAPQSYPKWQVAGTRIGEDQSYPGTSVFVVDFSGGDDLGEPRVEATLDGPSELVDSHVKWNPYSKSWRVVLRVSDVEGSEAAVELKGQLVFEDGERSEVWAYQWTR